MIAQKYRKKINKKPITLEKMNNFALNEKS